MAVSKDENLNFVLLLEQNKEVLEKSQEPSARKRKEEAAALFIEKWEETCEIKLTQAALLKKIHNLKSRAKTASNKGAPLKAWQKKILELNEA